jgi:hypothetical protein
VKNLKALFICSFLIAGAIVLLLIQRQIQIKLQTENESLREQIAQLNADIESLSNRLAQADNARPQNSQLLSDGQLNELLKLRGEVTVLQNDAKDPIAIAAKAWLVKVNKLKKRLEENPDAKIPEMQFLTEQDWLNVASKKLDTDADYRRALASLRSAGESKFGQMYQQALQNYSNVSNEQPLTDLSQLQPYFALPVDDAILQRWQIEPAKQEGMIQLGGDWVIVEKVAVDDIFDSRDVIGIHGNGSSSFLDQEIGQTLSPVYKAFAAANNGQSITDISQLLPYATTPEQQAALQKKILRASAY